GRPARPERGRAPAGQAGGHGSPLDAGRTGRGRAAGAVRLARRGHRNQPLRTGHPAPGQPDPDPQLGRGDRRARQRARQRTAAGGARVLGLPGDGGPGRRDAPARPGLGLGVVARLAVRFAAAPRRLAAAQPVGLHRPARRVVRGRDRPPALGGVRPHAHQRSGQPQHHRGRGHVVAGDLRGGLRGHLRRRHLVPAGAGAQGPAAVPGAAAHRGRREDARAPAVGRRARAHAHGGPVMETATWLPVAWYFVIGFGVLMYVLLDGFVLGLGVLAPFAEDAGQLDTMMNTAAPIWDGNETWLVLGGTGLLAAFPRAYGVLLSALYLPVLAMLIALIFRGVAFEFRFKARRARPFWGAAFAAGSMVAAFAQGVILGALVEGMPLEEGKYLGGAFDWFSPFSMLTGAAVMCGYALLGAGWLILKTEGRLQQVARTMTRPLVLVAVMFMGLVSAWLPFLDSRIMARWFEGG